MAIFKVSGIGENGKYMDMYALYDLINYVLNPEKTIHGYIGGMGVNPHNAYHEMTILSRSYNQDRGLRLRHWIISFSENELQDPAQANTFAQAACRHYGFQYQIIYGVHEDADHLHIHFVMNLISFSNGKRYRGIKKDYYDYLNELNDIGSTMGIHVQPGK